MNIYVGNLAYEATEEDLKALFEEHGEVISATVIYDKFSKRSKGFGFVEMKNAEDGKKAIDAINGKELKGREMRVNEARPREDNRTRNNNRR